MGIHWNHLAEAIQMNTHNMFLWRIMENHP